MIRGVYCTLLIFYIIGSLYRIQVDDSNLPVAFFKGGSKCRFCYFKFFYIGASHLASNSLWFDPDFWTCFGLAFRENSLQRGGFSAASEVSHPIIPRVTIGLRRFFFEHDSVVHDNDNDNQLPNKNGVSKKIGLNCLKRNIWLFPKIWVFPQIHPFKK